MGLSPGMTCCQQKGASVSDPPDLIIFNMTTDEKQVNNPLHGKTLEFILKQLVWHYGWEELGTHVKIACFTNDPSLKSSLKFLRKTDWARKKVEKLYLDTFD
ncbi:Uncharacterized conserved protein [Pedobacter antarcticus]|nr:Uncharacterized conserved protein [Pedobacter antarcticus]SFF29165.1 Uncharacterized conserved protein [Pedobacter antarcticus]